MDKKYTYEEPQSGMVSEPIATVAFNQPAVQMEVVKKTHNPKKYEIEQLDPELQEMIREQEESQNDPAWAEWAKGLTPEEWSKLGDYYDSMDEDDPTQWTDADVAFDEIKKEMLEYAIKIGKNY